MNGACKSKFVLAPPPGEGSKGQISFNFNYKKQFQKFLYQTLCLFSQMKYTKHIRRDIISVAWVMPLLDFGELWATGVKKNFKHGHVAYQIDEDDKQNKMQVTFSY